jgi:hypothetical protein
MEKLKFKNGEVEVITDIDEIVRLTLDNCKENTSEQKKRIEKYLRDNKPDKCLLFKSKKECNLIYYYTEESGEKCYDTYNGFESDVSISINNDKLFYEYYKTINDDERINNIINKIKAGENIFCHEQYSTVYKKSTIKKIEIELLYSRLVVSIYTDKTEKIILKNINKNGYFDGMCGSSIYPYSFKQQIEDRMLEHKKKMLKSLERNINKLRNEIENGIVW